MKSITRNGKRYYLVEGITDNTKLSTLAKKYSKNYELTGFPSMHLKKGKLLLIKRKTPLRKPLETWGEWEYQ